MAKLKKQARVQTPARPASVGLKSRRIKVRAISIGGGGASIISEISYRLSGPSFIAADTDEKTFRKLRRKIRPFLFGEKTVHGMGTGMDPDLAKKAALSDKEKIAKLFAGQDLVVLVAALGGGVASGAGPVFAEAGQEQKAVTIGIFTLPFEFEGDKKMRNARRAAGILKERLSGIIVVPNEKIFQLTDRKMPLKKALSALDDIFSAWLSDLLGIILKPSLINIDFADLKSILKDRGHELFLSQGEAGGLNRVEEVLKQVFHNPVFETGPKKVSRILFNVSGGKDLKLKEVEQISSSIAGLNQKAKIIFGLTDCQKLKGKIKVTLLAVSESEEKLDEKKNKKKKKRMPGLSKVPKEKEQGKAKNEKNTNQKPENGKSPASVANGKEKPRKNAMEVKIAQEEQEQREWDEGDSWDVPAFLRWKDKWKIKNKNYFIWVKSKKP